MRLSGAKAAAVSGLALAALALWALGRGRGAGEDATGGAREEAPVARDGGAAGGVAEGPPADGLPFGYVLPAGRRLDYALSLAVESSAAAAEAGPDEASGTLDGRIALDGTLRLSVLAAYPPAPGGPPARLRAELPEVRALQWYVLGQPLPRERAEAEYFAGRSAEVTLGPDGRVAALHFPSDTPRATATLLGLVLRQALVPLVAGRSQWRVSLETGLGEALVRVTLGACGADGCAVTAERGARDYTRFSFVRGGLPLDGAEVDGAHAFVVAPPGHLASVLSRERARLLRHGETVASQSVRVELRLVGRGEGPVAPAAGLVALEALPDRAREEALRARVRGLTFEALRADLLAHGNGGVMPDHDRWLWRATGLLRLEPGRAAELAALALDDRLTGTGKALVLDLLANVGHAQAQAAMREVLADERVRGDRGYVSLLQRFALVRAPDDESVRFLEARVRADSGDARHAALTMLGAALGRRDDPEALRAGVERLGRELAEATEPRARQAYVLALGATHSEAAVPALLAESRSADAATRAAAAQALALVPTAETAARLVELIAAEESFAVQARAVAGLSELTPTPEQLARLAALLGERRLAREHVHALVGALRQLRERVGDAALRPVAAALAEAYPDAGPASHAIAELRRALGP